MGKKNGRIGDNGNYQSVRSTRNSKNSRNQETMDMVLDKKIITPTPKIFNKKIRIKCKNKHQQEFIDMIDNNQIILCSGPAGCGKSHLSISKALELIQRDDKKYQKIYVITPTVEITKSIGALPGTFSEKVSVYMNSVYKLFDKIVGKEMCDNMLKSSLIEVLGLGYIRGENLDNCILIVEESQNVSIKEMLTILTRIGENCKLIISGDILQIDAFRCKEDSGLYHSMNKLKDIDEIGIFEFTNEDIVRNNIITKILQQYYK